MTAPVRDSRGFTLLEMIVAIAIFAIIAAVSYSALNNFLDARAHINSANERLRTLQTAFVLLEQDLRYAVSRPVRDEYGDAEPAFFGSPRQALAEGEALRLTTVRPAPVGAGVHQLTRVAWRLNDDALYRVAWRVLDRALDTVEYRRRLLQGVEAVEIRYMSYDAGGALVVDSEWEKDTALPVGVEVTVLLDDGSAYQRIFEIMQ